MRPRHSVLSLPRHCEGAGVRWTPLRSRSTDRAGRRDAKRLWQSAPLRVLRILSRSAFRMTHRLVIATTVKCAINCCPVIAKVRVSGGHLCGAEAPTEPAGETHKRLWQSAPLRVLRILSRSAFRMTSRSVVAAPAVGRLKRLNLLNSLFLLHIKAKNVKILLAEPFGRGYFLCSLKFRTAWLSFRANRY